MTLAPVLAKAPAAMIAAPWDSYALVDCGGGRKLERYGERLIVRPEPQCLWASHLDETAWLQADAVFEASDDDEAGRWRTSKPLSETWPMVWRGLRFHARLTAFRHLGVFPEHAANWSWIAERIAESPPGFRLLNLFGYSGVASLAAASSGAGVTHVDASKRAVGWARENAALSGLEGAPIRWLTEDARKWVSREVRRGARYDGIVLDPPKYGRGPDGEIWRLMEDLPDLLAGCAALLSDNARFLILNAYSERLTGLALAHACAAVMAERGGRIDWGELTLAEQDGRAAVGLSFFARWSAQ